MTFLSFRSFVFFMLRKQAPKVVTAIWSEVISYPFLLCGDLRSFSVSILCYLLCIGGRNRNIFDMEQLYPICTQGKQWFCRRKVLTVTFKLICFEKRFIWQPFHTGTCLGPNTPTLPDLDDWTLMLDLKSITRWSMKSMVLKKKNKVGRRAREAAAASQRPLPSFS